MVINFPANLQMNNVFTNLQNWTHNLLTFIDKENKCDCGLHLLSSSYGLYWINEYCINNLLHKLSKENKTVFLLGDYYRDLLNYDQHSLTNEFLDSLSYMLQPHYTTNKNKK